MANHGVYVHNGFLLLAIMFFCFQGFNLKRREPLETPQWNSFGYACVVAAFVFPFFI